MSYISAVQIPAIPATKPVYCKHPATEAACDKAAIHQFAELLASKMSKSRHKSRSGWQTCSVDDLWTMLREHVEKGDAVDVGCLAMMIALNGAARKAITAANTWSNATTAASERERGYTIAMNDLADAKADALLRGDRPAAEACDMAAGDIEADHFEAVLKAALNLEAVLA